MIKALITSLLVLTVNSTVFVNPCFAWDLYHDKKSNIIFSLDTFFREEFVNIFQPAIVLFIEGDKYTVVFYYNNKVKEENISKKFIKSLQKTIIENKSEAGLFVLSTENTCSFSLYIKSFNNNEKRDVSVLEKSDFDLFAKKYANLLVNEGFENVNVVNYGNFENRNITIELTGFRVKDSKALVKRVISRYGKIIELNALFDVPIEQRWQVSKYLKGVDQYLDAFAEDIAKAEEAGMNGHLAKPIDIEQLMQTLRGLL